MIDDGIEITVRYKNHPIDLNVRNKITLDAIEQFSDTNKIIELVTKQIWAKIEWELKCQELR